MKSIKTKLRYCLTLLLLGLFSFSSSYAQDTPTDEEVNQLLTSPDARTLEAYFLAQGYTDGGIIQGSQAAATSTLVSPSGRANASDEVLVRSTLVAKVFKNASGETIEIAYAADKPSNGDSRIEISADNATTNFFVVRGIVQAIAKASSFASKFENCWKQYVGGIASNCVSCYNCLKNAISSTSSTWLRIWRALKCAGPCFKCVSGIVGFVYCVIK